MDTLGNLLTSIRNAEAVNKASLAVPHAKASMAVLAILKENGYIQSFSTSEDKQKTITIQLIPGVKHTYKRISKPGRRLFTPATAIPMVLRGLGMVIISTSKGVMTGKQAHKQHLGGELICEVS